MSWEAAAIAANAAMNAIGSTIQSGSMNRRAARVARETNALNYKMFQEGNAFNERMFNEANAWNSPINQRKMLEEAGYNPAMLFDANIGAANPVNSSSPNPAQGYTPTAPDYSTIGVNAIQSYLALKQAKKVDAETLGQQIENGYKAENLAADLALKGAQTGNLQMVTKGQELKNIVDEASLEPDILVREEQANKALADADFAAYKTKQEKLKSDLYEIYGPKEAEQQYQNLVKQGGVLDEQKNTLFEEGRKYKAEGAAATSNAETNRLVGRSVAASNYAQAQKAYKESIMQDMRNDIYKRYGNQEAYWNLERLISNAQYDEAKRYLLSYDAKWVKEHPNVTSWSKYIQGIFGELQSTVNTGISAAGAVEGAKVLAK